LGVALLGALSSSLGCVEPYGSHETVSAQSDYVYYPAHEIYYNTREHQYVAPEQDAWVSRPEPRGVSVETLRVSPSVKLEFHDSPARHHAETVQKYPRNWAPPGPNQGRKDGDRGENDRK
jgi:hypothetical protein